MSEYNLTYDEVLSNVENGGGHVYGTFPGLFSDTAYIGLLEGQIVKYPNPGGIPSLFVATDAEKAATNCISGGDQPPK